MGYSCTVKAHDTLRMTLNNITGANILEPQFSNTWENKGTKFFYERGREQSDGSITGQVFKFINDTQCVKYGSLKILPDGKVKSWAGMPKDKIIDNHKKLNK